MATGFFNVPRAVNEPVKSYVPGSTERAQLIKTIEQMKSEVMDIPMIINGKEVRTENLIPIHPPHDRKYLLGHFHKGDAGHVQMAIRAALDAKEKWAALSWEHRAGIFLKAAELLAGPYRMKINAATMLGQSKNIYQAEIDGACELVDFFRFNVQYMTEIYAQQPLSSSRSWNRLEQRPLEGFVFALTPFNFTSIAGNLPSAPAIMGNTVVWKCSNTQVYSAKVIMDVFMEAGLPDGVINLVFVSGPVAGNEIFTHPDFAGIHFTGSTEVFQNIWKTIGNNIQNYKSYPRIVGETGGKDYIFAHPTASVDPLVVALVRGAFEYQGQKCSAVSRAYIPMSMWPVVREKLKDMIGSIKMGSPEDFTNFFNAVIDEASFDKLAGYIERAKKDADTEVIIGGGSDKSEGFFIEPTVILTRDPKYVTMQEELFGPVLTLYVYDDAKIEETLDLLNGTSVYALTGAIFATDRYAIEKLTKRLENTAGNFYINDKPTGAVVGRQPFGGARGSGTNDKAGSMINLLRWVSPRTIKENFLPPVDYRYPFMKAD
ncbi:MAG: L-glutamate gamma-semialdehyde dehydrogenase [Bacteroidales bacterium]|nr:L-glutamate gamma-semialdehyde dehydrogenase [Bacteroidales bacterium]MBN2698190.1 L-glutamate gamma-semialdehyde dehydrogenase [Bacteroidales bacterium]